MAQKYRKIDPRVWSDEGFFQLQPMEKLVAMYCLASSQTNRIGLFRLSSGMAAEEIGITTDEFVHYFDTVCHTVSWGWLPQCRTLYMPTWWKYNEPDNESAMVGCLSDLHDVPRCEFLKRFSENTKYLTREFNVLALKKHCSDIADTVSDTVSDTPPTQCPGGGGTRCGTSGAGAGAGAGAGNKNPYSPLPGDGSQPKVSRKRKKPDPSTPPAYTAEFEAAWSDYQPVEMTKGDKAAAFSRWSLLSDADRQSLPTAIAAYCRAAANTKQKTKHMCSWLYTDWRQWLDPTEAQLVAIDPEERERLRKREEFKSERERFRQEGERLRLQQQQQRNGK